MRSTYRLPQENVTGLTTTLPIPRFPPARLTSSICIQRNPKLRSIICVCSKMTKHSSQKYDAVYLYRLDLEKRNSTFVRSLKRLEGQVTATQMIQMNGASKLEKNLKRVWLRVFSATRSRSKRRCTRPRASSILLLRTKEHLILVATSLALSILFAIPLGVLAYGWPGLGQGILWLVAAINTIPSLALLVFIRIPLFGIGTLPAVIALFLYGLLSNRQKHPRRASPGISPALKESAIVLGLSPMARLLKIELPARCPVHRGRHKNRCSYKRWHRDSGAAHRSRWLWSADPHRYSACRHFTHSSGCHPCCSAGLDRARRIRCTRTTHIAASGLRLKVRS